MPVASDLYSLKRRLDRYFWHNDSPELVRLRHVLDKYFFDFDIVVIGGLVRDFAREGRAAFRSDVDLVIDAREAEVALLAEMLNARRNRFGGFGYYCQPWKIDFWALEATWAAKTGHVRVLQWEDLIKCTFFDWDAAVYNLSNRRVICDTSYLDKIRKQELEINLRPNPSVLGNLLRAVRRLILWNLKPGPRLWSFMKETLSDETFAAIKRLEFAEHPHTVMRHFADADALWRYLVGRECAVGKPARATQHSLALETTIAGNAAQN